MSLEKKGLFVVFEGADGAGTTTQARLFEEYVLNILGFKDVQITREPTNSFYGGVIRQILKNQIEAEPSELAELFVYDSVYNNKHNIKPVLERGGVISSDRYRPSSFAYQPSADVPEDFIWWLHEREGDRLEIPDYTFYLNVDKDIAINRANSRGTVDLEIFETLEFQEKVLKRYRSLIDNGLKYFGKVIEIDATKNIPEVASEIQRKFSPIYEKWRSAS